MFFFESFDAFCNQWTLIVIGWFHNGIRICGLMYMVHGLTHTFTICSHPVDLHLEINFFTNNTNFILSIIWVSMAFLRESKNVLPCNAGSPSSGSRSATLWFGSPMLYYSGVQTLLVNLRLSRPVHSHRLLISVKSSKSKNLHVILALTKLY